jgi:hypothetical protein
MNKFYTSLPTMEQQLSLTRGEGVRHPVILLLQHSLPKMQMKGQFPFGTGFVWLRMGARVWDATFCEHENVPSGTVKDEFLDGLF